METKSLVALALVLSGIIITTQTSNADEAKQLNDSASAKHFESESAFELEPIEVTRGNISFEEELTLRIVRQAFKEVPSNKREDIDKLLCWLEKPVGSRISRLGCARNGDVWALRPDNTLDGSMLLSSRYKGAGYGEFMIASRPMTRGRLKKILAALPGTDSFDKEFIAMAINGDKPPRNAPTEQEIDQFAKAWLQIKRLNKRGKSEDIQIAAINTEGLTLKRYNQIAELTETYKSIKKDISTQVKLFR